MALEPGTELGHYGITDLIGKGGMGEVYRARDTRLGREVAIKVLPYEFSQDHERLARLEREARMLAALNHPNIAAIYGLEESDDTRFLVLELVEGDTLATRLKDGAIPVEESLKLGLQIAEALEAAHEKSVIHRDLKPANIKITPERRVKVLDFGLAKAFVVDRGDVNLSNSPTLSMQATQQGVILGTAGYMSPEQVRGENVDARADIWAFGCVLYEMLTGRTAFDGGTVSDILAGVLRAEPDWRSLPANLHPRLRFLLERCLEKVPANRAHDIADIRADVQKILNDPDGVFVTPVASAGPLLTRRSALALGATALGAAGIGGVLGWLARVPADPLVTRLLVSMSGIGTGGIRFAISRDGRTLAYASGQQIYTRSLSEFSAQPLPGAEGLILDLSFSPDGEWLVYADLGAGIRKIPIAGGAPQSVAPIRLSLPGPAGLHWDETDTILYTVPEGIMAVPAQGGEPPATVVVPQPGEQLGAGQLLPDGDSILFSATQASGDTRWDAAKIVVQSRSSDVRRTLVRGGSAARYLAGDYLVYAVGNSLKAVQYPPRSSDTRNHVTVLDGVGRPPDDSVDRVLYALSDNGDLIYVATSDLANLPPFDSQAESALVWVDRDGNEEAQVSVAASGFVSVRVSPDGRWAAVVHSSNGSTLLDSSNGSTLLAVLDLQTGSLVDLTSGFILSPAWSPDSERIYFHRNPGTGVTEVAEIDRGGGEVRVLASFQGEAMSPSVMTRDGTLIGSLRNPETGGTDIVALGTDGAISEILPGEPIRNDPDLSPDGRWIAYAEANGEDNSRVILRPYPEVGRFVASVPGPGRSPKFSADGSEIYYYDGEGISAVSVAYDPNPRFAQSRPLVRGPYAFGVGGNYFYAYAAWDWDPTRDRFLMIRRDEATTDRDFALDLRVVQNWRQELATRVPAQ